VLIVAAMPSAASPPSVSDSNRSIASKPSRRSLSSPLWIGLGAATLTTVALFNDGWLTQESTEAHSSGERRLASALEPLGNTACVGPAILLAYGVARLTGHEGLADASRRIGAEVAVAGLATLALKEAVGRARPSEAPDDPDRFAPFSRHQSFPSGHTAIAFAAATALSDEIHSAWTPWIAYPVAAAVGWSRVHDREHWTSDVVVGAAVGTLSAIEVQRALFARAVARRVSIDFVPQRAGGIAAVDLRF
jgi:membrane-associated phospholipid phosphatase